MRNVAVQQLEQLLDEDPGATVGVLVQVADPDPAGSPPDDPMALSARELLPKRPPQTRAQARADLRAKNEEALAPVLAAPNTASRGFWPARTAYLEVSRDDLARLVADTPGVTGVYPDQRVTLPPVSKTAVIPGEIAENSTASWGITDSGALAVWGAYGARGKGVRVGVLDTGVDAGHPDLVGKVAAFAEFDDAGNEVRSQPHDSDEHGTHVCGTIAGGAESGQFIGMAPEAELVVGLVLKGGSGTTKQVLTGLTWALDQHVDVLSMSLSSPVFDAVAPASYSAAFHTCQVLGVPVVAAIGNRGANTGATTGSDFFAIGVGALDHRGVAAGFSGGITQLITESDFIADLPVIYIKPDLAAPGYAVVSSIPKDAEGNTYAAMNGTSMATPHVAGAVALLLSAVPEIRRIQADKRATFIRQVLLGSVDELGEAGKDSRYGYGRLNVLRAIAVAKQVFAPKA